MLLQILLIILIVLQAIAFIIRQKSYKEEVISDRQLSEMLQQLQMLLSELNQEKIADDSHDDGSDQFVQK